jgi:hypothetical protein
VTSGNPDVGGAAFFRLTHSGGTTVTDFTNEQAGQVIDLLFTNANVTIQHGTNIKLAGGTNFVGSANDMMQLRSDGTTWYEVCRSVNG